MTYASKTPNAMILPLPIRHDCVEPSIRFISLEGHGEFFDKLRKGFPHIPQYHDYGFAVFQLNDLEGKPHPMAFEFRSRWASKLFFPTVHIHDGEVHATEDFDHQLYLQHAGLDSVVGVYDNQDVKDQTTGFVRSDRIADHLFDSDTVKGILEPELLVHRTALHGRSVNQDQVFSIDGDPVTPKWNLKPLARLLPWLIPVFGFGWFLRRRQQLRPNRAARRT